MPLFCKACGDRVRIHELRDHLQAHGSDTEGMSWPEVQSHYEHKKLEKEVTVKWIL